MGAGKIFQISAGLGRVYILYGDIISMPTRETN